jgi:hypothetical protein
MVYLGAPNARQYAPGRMSPALLLSRHHIKRMHLLFRDGSEPLVHRRARLRVAGAPRRIPAPRRCTARTLQELLKLAQIQVRSVFLLSLVVVTVSDFLLSLPHVFPLPNVPTHLTTGSLWPTAFSAR